MRTRDYACGVWERQGCGLLLVCADLHGMLITQDVGTIVSYTYPL